MAARTGHVGIDVTNLERSKQFYQAVLGLEILGESAEEGRRLAFLGNPDVSSEDFLDRLCSHKVSARRSTPLSRPDIADELAALTVNEPNVGKSAITMQRTTTQFTSQWNSLDLK
jgi:catechol 2,3-dioxygenase-like lactoylglutathione lyase family enzyme